MRIALGYEDAPTGVTQNAMAVGLSWLAYDKGDMKTAAQLLSRTSLRSTRWGQEIVSLRGNMGNESPMNAVKQVIGDRLERIAESYKTAISSLDLPMGASKKEKAIAYIKNRTENLKTELKERTRKIQDAQAIINALKCK